MDQVRRRLVALVAARTDLDLKNLSLRLGHSHSYLHHFIHKGSPRELKERDRLRLAAIFGVPESELKHTTDDDLKFAQETETDSNFRAPVVLHGRPDFLASHKTLPILGYAKDTEGAFFIGNGEISGYTVCPDILVGVKGAYAVEFWDDSMEPAFKNGHLGWVHPRKPVSPGDDVVVQLVDGQALTKALVRRTEKHLVLKQYNPQKEIRIDREKVRSVHLIVGSLRIRA